MWACGIGASEDDDVPMAIPASIDSTVLATLLETCSLGLMLLFLDDGVPLCSSGLNPRGAKGRGAYPGMGCDRSKVGCDLDRTGPVDGGDPVSLGLFISRLGTL